MSFRKLISFTAAGLLALPLLAGPAHAGEPPREIRLDYAYYSAPSLVIRKFGWLDDEFRKEGIPIKWVFSQGSNNSLEYLNAGSSDFASTSGISALVSRANGFPVKLVYVVNTNEASALLVSQDSPVKSVTDLKGKRIAATKGTDPFFFLLRTLNASGLHKNDVEIVHLQHPEGRAALQRKTVDAWAGLDPHMASAEVEDGARVLYRNPAFSSYVVLNTTENFARQYPDELVRVLKVYERARKWILANRDETIRIVAEESKQSPQVIRQAFTRANFEQPVPGKIHIETIRATLPILVEENIVKKGIDLPKTLKELVDTRYAEIAVKAAAR